MCAVDFRHLSSTTATILSKVSHWLDSTIAFFEHLSTGTSVTNAEVKQFVIYGKQAKELARSFEVLAAWGRDLSGKLHEMQEMTKKEITSVQTKAEKAQLKAIRDAEAKREKLEDAVERRERTEMVQSLVPALAAMGISPVGLMIQSSQSAQARKIEKQAANEYHTAIMELQKKASKNDKTQVRH